VQELPVAAHLATAAVRRQFAPDAPPEPDPIRRARSGGSGWSPPPCWPRRAGGRPAPECSAAH
jgi:hypothetical protein